MLNKSLQIVLVCLLLAGCRREVSDPSLRDEMRDAYGASLRLFSYTWSPEKFSDPASEKEIIALLTRLASDFHRIERDAPIEYFEPGFRIALQVNSDLLRDVERRFKQGNKDYANWRLRGLAQNCIACHTRLQVPLNFDGSVPQDPENSIEAQLAVSEFLIATRQFERASRHLLEQAKAATGRSDDRTAIRALKLWLVVQLRVRPDFKRSAEQLGGFVSLVHPDAASLIVRWVRDLRNLKIASAQPLRESRELLRVVSKAEMIADDDRALVTTLRATALLHTLLSAGNLATDERREASYLLGLAYHHIQIPVLEVFRPLYLEQCIREFPRTREARLAFALYESEVILSSSGSGGVNLGEVDAAKLRELQNLSFGSSDVVLPDTGALP